MLSIFCLCFVFSFVGAADDVNNNDNSDEKYLYNLKNGIRPYTRRNLTWNFDVPPPEHLDVEDAYVTMACGDEYANGVLTVAKALRLSNSTKPMIVLIGRNATTGEITVSDSALHLLHMARLKLILVDIMKPWIPIVAQYDAHFSTCCWTKLRLWQLAWLKKGVWLDADTLPIRNLEDLFEKPQLSAPGAPGFNAGLMVFEPNLTRWETMMERYATVDHPYTGDQPFLVDHFWFEKHPLPQSYNIEVRQFKMFRRGIRIAHVLHFTTSMKPWNTFVSPLYNEWGTMGTQMQMAHDLWMTVQELAWNDALNVDPPSEEERPVYYLKDILAANAAGTQAEPFLEVPDARYRDFDDGTPFPPPGFF